MSNLMSPSVNIGITSVLTGLKVQQGSKYRNPALDAVMTKVSGSNNLNRGLRVILRCGTGFLLP